MASTAPNLLLAVELRLLRCTLPPSSPLLSTPSPPLISPIEQTLSFIERGDYAAALSTAHPIFTFAKSFEFDDTAASAALFYAQVEESVKSYLQSDTADLWLQVLDPEVGVDAEFRFALVLCLGVAALLAFVQQNVTGPVGKFSPFPLIFPTSAKDGGVNGGEWDNWARREIESVGLHLDAKFSLLQYFVYAKILLSMTKDLSMEGRNSCLTGGRSICWWLCRLVLIQQRILDELSSSLYGLLQVFKEEMLAQFGKLESVTDYWGSILFDDEASMIVSVAHLEAGILEYKYGRVDSSRLHLRCAEEGCGMNISLTGVLGFRTIHQVDAKPQMVLVANTDQQKHNGQSPAIFSLSQSDGSAHGEKSDSHPHGHTECSDILMTPRLVENGNANGINGYITNIGKDMTLTAIQQAVTLAQCLPLCRSQRDDELSRWEMAPYIEAVDAQHHSCYVVRSFCEILRIRWESNRSHTKERAFLMLDKLVANISEPLPVAAERIQCSFGADIPTIPALRKEYCLHCVSCGMISEALTIFEDLELWNDLIDCYCLLGKKAAAVDLIKARLCDKPTDPRLWCSLGDVTKNDTCYEKALEVSNNKSVRAKRALARSAYDKGDYAASKILWQSAMSINSLFPGGWFALGTAALQDQDIDKALDGFTRAVQLEPDHGEAWNNIAYLHLIKKRSKPAFIAFKEALKFRRTSWQLWENYSYVAFDIGYFQQALEATKMVLNLSSNKRVDVELLDKVMKEVEERTFKPVSSLKDLDGQTNSSHSTTSSGEYKHLESVHEETRETENLTGMLGNILQQIIRSGGGGEVWGLYARWHKIKGNLVMCSEALLKEVRSYQGSDLWHDQDRFKKFAHASLQLCKVYMEISSSSGSRRELTTAEMHLRNSVKQAVNFTDTEELKALQSCLEEVKKLLDAKSIEGA